MRRLLLRALGVALVATAAAGLVVLSVPWWLPASRGPAAAGRLALEALEGPARIVRDPFGVPHVEAAGARDAFLALGFAHAQDRLWQMDVLRRAASGRLSELFGSTTLPEDRLARTLGFAAAAADELDKVRGSTRELLAAYATGVNAWVREVREGRQPAPAEYRWLGLQPEPWRPEDTLAIVRFRAWLFGRSLGATLLLDRLVRQLGGLSSQEFFPRPTRTDHMEGLVGRLLPLARLADRSAGVAGLRGRVGSSGFVVGASRSRSGAPLLANDPHVELRLPPVFHVAHLRTPGWEVAGGTWPGVPVFWVGTNGAIAWGQVALHSSVSDLYEEALHPTDPYRYDRGGRWLEARRREERIAVRGHGEEVVEVVRTRHGPLLGSALPEDPALGSVALRWTGDVARSGIDAHLALQRATDWAGFRRSLENLVAPAVTFLYADRGGRVATQVVGHLPVRSIDTGLLPVPGRSGFYDWRGYIPFEELPSAGGGRPPWLIAATRPPDVEFTRPVAWLWTDPGTTERAGELLETAGPLGLDEAVAIQRDRKALAGRRQVRALLEGIELSSRPAVSLARLLLAWDGGTERDSAGAAAFHVFRYQLSRTLLGERLQQPELRRVLESAEPVPGVLLAGFLRRVDRAEARRYVERALEATWSWLGVEVSSNTAKWTWGRIHQLDLRHDFERLGGPWLRWVGRAHRIGPFPVPGSPDSLWTMYSPAAPPFRTQVGPALRFAVDLAHPDHAVVGLAGGQSGHAGSPHHEDGLRRWLAGKPHPLWMHPADISFHAAGIWELLPRPSGPVS